MQDSIIAGYIGIRVFRQTMIRYAGIAQRINYRKKLHIRTVVHTNNFPMRIALPAYTFERPTEFGGVITRDDDRY